MATEDRSTSPSYKIIWNTNVFFLLLSKMKRPPNTKQFCSYQPQNVPSLQLTREGSILCLPCHIKMKSQSKLAICAPYKVKALSSPE